MKVAAPVKRAVPLTESEASWALPLTVSLEPIRTAPEAVSVCIWTSPLNVDAPAAVSAPTVLGPDTDSE